ncbi:MAG: tRNA (guanosine(46)-N7)-methyltransferase TrmB [Rhodospirillaceae bacterium]|nr:tRNA (guanosine(46)-N7)-methyltransferase TrmB [Rhodospirillaceae bacterium]
MDPEEQPRFYGRRRGKRLRPGRRALLENLLPTLRVPPGDGPLDPAALFDGKKAAYWMEIGFGAGEHMADQAAAHPDIGFIGCEPFVNGVATLLAQITERSLDNIRLHDDDARQLLPRLTPGSIDRVYLLYSDPWPKKRHWNRRFVQRETLDQLARILAPGGLFRFATDHMGHARWALGLAANHPEFQWTARGPEDWRRRWADGYPTRYEEKGLAGPARVYLEFRRRGA